MGNQQGPTDNTWNSTQCMPARMGEEFGGRMDTCICMAESLGCSLETTVTLLISYYLLQNKQFKVRKKKTFEQRVLPSACLASTRYFIHAAGN